MKTCHKSDGLQTLCKATGLGEEVSNRDGDVNCPDCINLMTKTTPPIMEQADAILQFFSWKHLPAPLQEVSKPFSVLADLIVSTLPRNAERTVALRKLLESKDAAVRARLASK